MLVFTFPLGQEIDLHGTVLVAQASAGALWRAPGRVLQAMVEERERCKFSQRPFPAQFNLQSLQSIHGGEEPLVEGVLFTMDSSLGGACRKPGRLGEHANIAVASVTGCQS